MRRLLVIFAALVIPVAILALIFVAGGTPTAVAGMEADGVAVVSQVPVDAAGQSVMAVEPEGQVRQGEPGQRTGVVDPWRQEEETDYLSAGQLAAMDRERREEGPSPYETNVRSRPSERPSIAPPVTIDRSNGTVQERRPVYSSPPATRPEQRRAPTTYQSDVVMAAAVAVDETVQSRIVAAPALTLTLSPLHRGTNSSAYSSGFVFTNSSGLAADYVLDFYWVNGQPAGTYISNLDPGASEYFSLENNAPFIEQTWVGGVSITSDQLFIGQIATPDYGWISGIVVKDDGVTPYDGTENHVSLSNFHNNDNYGDTHVLSDGRFYLGGLDFNQYRLFLNVAYPWASQWYDRHSNADYEQADAIDVPNPDPVTITVTLEPGGMITGTVYAANGTTPLDQINVDVEPGGYGTCTNTSGKYTLEGLGYGDQVVVAGGGWNWCKNTDAIYAREYYNEVTQQDQATTIHLSMTQDVVQSINFTLDPAGQITGTVYAEDGTTPLENVNVDVEQGGYGTCTDQDGEYVIGGLPYGDHKVFAGGGYNWCTDSQSPYTTEYFEEQSSPDTATTLTLSEIQTLITGIDFTLSTGGTIAGQVRADDGGTLLANVRVEARTYDSNDYGNDAWTDASGMYTLTGLLDEDYQVSVQDQNEMPAGYAWQFYDHTQRWDEAARVTISGGGTVENIDFDLLSAGVITGWVTDDQGTPLADIQINAQAHNGNYGWGFCTDENGYYEARVLPYEDWIVQAGGGWNECKNQPSEWAREYYEEQTDWQNATVLTLDAGNQLFTDINFTLEPAGMITGYITDEADNPLANINVDAHSDSRGSDEGMCTDENGYYVLAGLGYADDWVVSSGGNNHCQDQSAEYVRTFYDNVHSYDQAQRLLLDENNTVVGNINIKLLEGGKITGRVTDAGSGSHLANVPVSARPYDDGGDDRWGETDASGYYTITGLMDDDYRVSIEGGIPAGYAQQYYPDTFIHEYAERVNISGFGTAADIDFRLEPGGVITGYVVDHISGLPIAEMNVSAGLQNDHGGRGTCTDGSGYYELDGLIYADYVVNAPADANWNWCLEQPQEFYAQQYYDHVYNYDDATLVEVNSPDPKTDVNFSLEEGSYIEGNVEDEGSNPVAGLRMEVLVPGGCPWCHQQVAQGDTDANGDFSLGPLTPGQYAVYACTGCSDILLVDQYYPDAFHVQDATMISISAGVDATGINMTLDPGIWLTGTVFVPGGYDDNNIQVDAWQEEPDGFGTGRSTNVDGDYIIPVPPIYDSEWAIRVMPWETDLYMQQASRINLASTNWDFHLDVESVISGRVQLKGGGTPDYGQINAQSRWMDHGTEIDQNGYYEIHQLPPGEYQINFDGQPDYMWTYYGGHDWSFASEINLGEQEIVGNINIDVQRLGHLEGYVYDSDGSTPIEGAEIIAMDGVGRWYAYSQHDGYFSIDLPATDVRVMHNPADWPTHMFGFYDGAHTYADATVVPVPPFAPAEDSAYIEIIFERRSTIEGQVRDADSGDPLDGILVSALTVDSAADWENASYACTEEDGNYYLEGVSPGDVEVMAIGTCGADEYGLVTSTLTVAPDTNHTVNLSLTAGTGLPDVFTIRADEIFGYTPIRGLHGTGLQMRDQILPLLYAPLADLDDQGNWYSELLDRLPTEANSLAAVVGDHLEVTYELKSGLKWSDGAPLTSADIRFTWEKLTEVRWLMDEYMAQVSAVWKVEEVLTPDPLTAVFVYERGVIPPAYLGAITQLMPEHLLGGRHATDIQLLSNYAHNPIGNGPYMVADWVPGSHMDLVANPNYHKSGDGLPIIREMRLLYNAHPFWGVVGGRADVSLYADPEQVPDSWDTFGVELHTVNGMGFATIVPNLTKPLFQDVQVRKALFTALDRQSFSDDHSLVDFVADGYLPPDHPLYSSTHVTYTYNLGTAAAMLDAAGWLVGGDGIREKDGQRFEFDLYYNEGNSWRQDLALMFANDLASIGVDANVISMPWEDYYQTAVRGELDAYMMGWVFDNRFDPYGYGLYHSRNHPTAYNRYEGSVHNSGWYDNQNDTILLNTTTELDFDELSTLYGDHLALYSDHLPEWPVNHMLDYHVVSPFLLNFLPEGGGNMAVTWNAEYWEVPAIPIDISVRKTLAADSQAPKPGNTITYEVEIRNVGYFEMTGVGFNETLPDDVVYLGADPAPDSIDGNTLEWNLGSVAGETAWTPVYVQVQIPPTLTHGTTLVNSAEVWANEIGEDIRPGNNSYVFELTVRDDVDLAVTKSGVGEPAIGEKFNYFLDYYNLGGAQAAGVVVTDVLPAEVSFISADPAPTAMSGQLLTWTVGTLPGNQWGGRIEITAEIDAPGTVKNMAGVDYPDVDTDPGNNSDDHTEIVDSILEPVILRPTQGSTDETPTISGLAPSNAKVDIWDLSIPAAPSWVISTTATGLGEFEVEPTMTPGTYVLVAKASKSGLDSGDSNAATITVKDNLPLDPDSVTIKSGGVDVSAGSVEAERRMMPMRNLTIQADLDCGSRPTPTLWVTENAFFEYAVPPVQVTDLGGGEWDVSFTFWMAEPHSSYEIWLEWDCGAVAERVLLMFILIDPYGFVYDQNLVDGGSAIEDALILDAEITCYVRVGDNWLVWPAGLYGQVNPQYTDSSTEDGVMTPGFYSYLTPSGRYKIKAVAPGYQPFESEVLTVITEVVHLDVGLLPIVQAESQARAPASLVNSRKAVDRNQGWLWDELTYDIWLENSGEIDTEWLKLTDEIPDRTSYINSSLVVEGGSGSYSATIDAIVWEGAITATNSIHLQYKVLVASTPGTPFNVINDAQVEGSPAIMASAPVLAAVTQIQNVIDLTLESDDAQVIEAGQTAYYTHTITNTGNFTDTFTFSGVSSEGWTVQIPSDVLLDPGESTVVQVWAWSFLAASFRAPWIR